jgi:hypothetical protein
MVLVTLAERRAIVEKDMSVHLHCMRNDAFLLFSFLNAYHD